jgi:hypothetical protein
VPAEALDAATRDQAYLSLCLALLSAAAQRGIWLPMVLDDPFERLDARATASLAAVLVEFARQGHQVMVLTGQQAAAQRLKSIGVGIQDMASLRRQEPIDGVDPETAPLVAAAPVRLSRAKKPKTEKRQKSRTVRNSASTAVKGDLENGLVIKTSPAEPPLGGSP